MTLTTFAKPWRRGTWCRFIPMRKSRKLRVAVDRTLYRLRNLVERCFNKLKNARRVATRYDKTARNFLAAIHLAAAIAWLN